VKAVEVNGDRLAHNGVEKGMGQAIFAPKETVHWEFLVAPPEDGIVRNHASQANRFGAAKEALRLVAEMVAEEAAVVVETQATPEVAGALAKHQTAPAGAQGLGAYSGEQQVRQLCAGEPGGSDSGHRQGEGAVAAHEV
jgi:hypothetical protein